MKRFIREASYPLTFRKQDVEMLGNHLKLRHSVQIIGIKRVGISNFLRFFMYRDDVVKTYVDSKQRHLFVHVNLYDIIENTRMAFWRLTLKRIVDIVNSNKDLEPLRHEANRHLDKVFQMNDLLLTIEAIRSILVEIVLMGINPTIFFVRFDRINDVVNHDFVSNLQGLVGATNGQLAYVFTSYREVELITSEGFQRNSAKKFLQTMHLLPAKEEDMKSIFTTLQTAYDLTVSSDQRKTMLYLAGGHVQYLQDMFIILNENRKQITTKTTFDQSYFEEDERIQMQSEEIYERLLPEEKELLTRVISDPNAVKKVSSTHNYLQNTGIIDCDTMKCTFLSPFFLSYVKRLNIKQQPVDLEQFTKKEHLLYQYLVARLDKVCERDDIIRAVWPEFNEIGISDWAIDRLVSRVRKKIKTIDPSLKINTIKTRGYLATRI